MFADSRVARVRELKAENARLREELERERAAGRSLRAHFDLALKAALDAAAIPPGGTFVIVDGWNAILGAGGLATAGEFAHVEGGRSPEGLLGLVRRRLAAHEDEYAWVLFDGSRAAGRVEERLTVSWTGGEGAHRADRMACDYLRMRRLSGLVGPVVVVTDDRDFAREVRALGAVTSTCIDYLGAPQ